MQDPVSNVLKWVLLTVAVGSFALFAWATVLTYRRAAPQPDRFVAAGGAIMMTPDDIVAGKTGFRKADLMDVTSNGSVGECASLIAAGAQRAILVFLPRGQIDMSIALLANVSG